MELKKSHLGLKYSLPKGIKKDDKEIIQFMIESNEFFILANESITYKDFITRLEKYTDNIKTKLFKKLLIKYEMI